MPGWQKQGHTWHIVPRNYSSKVGLIDLIIEKNRGKEEKKRGKWKNRKDSNGFRFDHLFNGRENSLFP